jgi:hypothetical protein
MNLNEHNHFTLRITWVFTQLLTDQIITLKEKLRVRKKVNSFNMNKGIIIKT